MQKRSQPSKISVSRPGKSGWETPVSGLRWDGIFDLDLRSAIMKNRIVAGALIFFLAVFDFSCLMYSIKKESPEIAAFRRGSRNEVLAVMKKSKEYVEFSANRRGRIVGDHVVGLARQRIKKELEIPGSRIARIEER